MRNNQWRSNYDKNNKRRDNEEFVKEMEKANLDVLCEGIDKRVEQLEKVEETRDPWAINDSDSNWDDNDDSLHSYMRSSSIFDEEDLGFNINSHLSIGSTGSIGRSIDTFDEENEDYRFRANADESDVLDKFIRIGESAMNFAPIPASRK